MSFYKQQEFDFIDRTKKIIKQYDNLVVPKEEEKYEVTLLLNCMVGLLILPQQNWFNNLPTDLITNKSWGIDEAEIKVIKDRELKDEDKTVANIARHLRNSIAHYRFEAFNNSKDEINSIKFEDYICCKKNNIEIKEQTFEATINLENLQEFVYKLSNDLVSQIKKSK